MVVSHRYDFRRPSIKRAEEGIATMSANMVSIDEEPLKSDLRELVRKTVQETLNALLDEKAGEMVGAGRYERTGAREAYRSGHHKRKLVTTGGEVVLDVPMLRGVTLLRLRGRGLSGVRLVAGDKSLQIQIDPLVEGYGVAVATGLPVTSHTGLHQQPLTLVVVVGCHLVRQRGARAHDAHPFCQDEKTRLPAEMLRLDNRTTCCLEFEPPDFCSSFRPPSAMNRLRKAASKSDGKSSHWDRFPMGRFFASTSTHT